MWNPIKKISFMKGFIKNCIIYTVIRVRCSSFGSAICRLAAALEYLRQVSEVGSDAVRRLNYISRQLRQVIKSSGLRKTLISFKQNFSPLIIIKPETILWTQRPIRRSYKTCLTYRLSRRPVSEKKVGQT